MTDQHLLDARARPDGRTALRSLADEVRELSATLVRFDADDDTLTEVAGELRVLTARLRGAPRSPGSATRFDLAETAGKAFSAAHGIGNPIAQPLSYRWVEDEVVAEWVLGPQYEGRSRMRTAGSAPCCSTMSSRGSHGCAAGSG